MEATRISCKDGLDLVTVRGIVVPIAWDSEGKVTTVAISTVDEEEILVADDEQGRELIQWMQESIEATGVLKGRGQQGRILEVRHYGLAPPPVIEPERWRDR